MTRRRGRPAPARLFDVELRTRKARKLRSMLHDFHGQWPAGLWGVDIGCSRGVISAVLAEDFALMVALDIDRASIVWAQKHSRRANTHFLVADGLQPPLPGGAFDVVICAQSYEHVPDARRLSAEIFRLLKPGGVCVFSGPNRLAPIEDHYGLPLLSWLPRPLASACLRLTGRGQSYQERPVTYWGLQKLWRDFEIQDYTVAMIRAPEAYSIENELGPFLWLRHLPAWLLRILLIFAPNYNWILRKPERATPT